MADCPRSRRASRTRLADPRGAVALGVGGPGGDEDDVGHGPDGPEHDLVALAPQPAGDPVDDGGAVDRLDHVDQDEGPVLGRLAWQGGVHRLRVGVVHELGKQLAHGAEGSPVDHRPRTVDTDGEIHSPRTSVPQARFPRVRRLQRSGRIQVVGVRGPGGSGAAFGAVEDHPAHTGRGSRHRPVPDRCAAAVFVGRRRRRRFLRSAVDVGDSRCCNYAPVTTPAPEPDVVVVGGRSPGFGTRCGAQVVRLQPSGLHFRTPSIDHWRTHMALAPEQTGIGIRRHFTTEGTHPYDEVEWERRDARITNFRDGTVAFEQLDVEFPATLVAERHQHRRPEVLPGHARAPPERECVAAPGHRPGGRHHHRVGRRGTATSSTTTRPRPSAPSSSTCSSPRRRPSTRRSGSTSACKGVPQQARACFILAVDDTMDSILNWYVEEGTIFKGGSGSGINLSRIRSSPRAAEGRRHRQSGPVSFMRGADASAGTIKSGGKTRRAAKMVILDVDHPDIEEFIWCKAREERKARVLRDAGFDMDLDGTDSHSIQYQNANNSVRVTDEFMQAVVDDADWHLRAVTTGEVIKTVRARDLMRQIAQATWECADPGMQFDTTINRWHTAANTGRINGSNPCSEYMHLDNSACNLASLNLLKFLDDDDTVRRRRLQGRRRGRLHRPGDPRRQRRLPDRADRRERPPLPPARPRLRQPRRPAHGPRPALRLRRGPGLGRRHHRAHDRPRLRHLGPHRRPHGAVRRLRRERRAHAAGARHAPRGGGRDRRGAGARRAARRRPAGVGRGLRARPRIHGVRNSQAIGARPHRHHRPDDGLRHHRHRARPRPVQDEEAGRRRHDDDRQPDGAPGAAPPRLHRRRRSTEIVAYIDEHKTILGAPHLTAEHIAGVRLLDGRQRHPLPRPREDDGRGAAVHLRRHLQDGQHARGRHGRGRRAAPHRRLAARPQGGRHLPRQLQGGPAAGHGQEGRRAEDAAGRRRRGDRRSSSGSSSRSSSEPVRQKLPATRRARGPSSSGWPTARASSPSASTRTAGRARSSSRSPSRARPWPGSWTPSPSRSATACSTACRCAASSRRSPTCASSPRA